MKHLLVCSCLATILTFGLAAPRAFGQSAGYDFKADLLADMQGMKTKYVGLAQAIPADKYTWRPGEGVRSVSEVFLHAALMNFAFTPMAGAAPPQGFNRDKYETSTTDKAKIIDQLNQAFDYSEAAIQKMSNDDLAKQVKAMGHESAAAHVLFFMDGDLHEHLGQMISYARMNGVVPPWTAARQAGAHAE